MISAYDSLQQYLSKALQKRVVLELTRHRRTFLSSRECAGGVLEVRLRRDFLEAPPAVWEAVALFLKAGKPVHRVMMLDFLKSVGGEEEKVEKRIRREHAQGRYVNLRERADRINLEQFGGRHLFSISWNRGVRPTAQPPRSLRLGLCCVTQREILMHPLLDHPEVPLYYVDYIIHHEIAHLEVEPELGEGGRMRIHSPEFHAVEKQFPQYREAVEYGKKGLKSVIEDWWKNPGFPPRVQKSLANKQASTVFPPPCPVNVKSIHSTKVLPTINEEKLNKNETVDSVAPNSQSDEQLSLFG
ncbi:MAG: hypothetical protein SFY68_07955 [Candidatus Sumerlaeia bacterium]|nr:hypothetical protein [Candidatus Sumerlaeia bacterium]